MKLIITSVVLILALTSLQCNFKWGSDHDIIISAPDVSPENPLKIYWNGTEIESGKRVEISVSNTLTIMSDNNKVIAEVTIVQGAQYLHGINISESCTDESCANTLCGQIYEINPDDTSAPISDVTVLNHSDSYTRTNGTGYYSLCFANSYYDYVYKRAGVNNDIHVTVNTQNDRDLKIDVYFDDTDEPVMPPNSLL